jgi:hypothetical protein
MMEQWEDPLKSSTNSNSNNNNSQSVVIVVKGDPKVIFQIYHQVSKKAKTLVKI